MKKLIIGILITIGAAYGITVMGSAPFCKVNRSGTMAQCYYYTMDSCRMSAFGGEFCVMR